MKLGEEWDPRYVNSLRLRREGAHLSGTSCLVRVSLSMETGKGLFFFFKRNFLLMLIIRFINILKVHLKMKFQRAAPFQLLKQTGPFLT